MSLYRHPFMQAGEEILRTKVKEDGSYDSNSYSSGDEINCIKWETLDDAEYQKNLQYYKDLIAFRKNHGLLRLDSSEEVAKRVTALENLDKNVVAFVMDNADKAVEGESAEGIFLAFNPNEEETSIELPSGNWKVSISSADDSDAASQGQIISGQVKVAPISSLILTKDDSADTGADKASESGKETSINKGGIAIMLAGAAAIIAVILAILKRKK